jgi:hypothetical protein
MEAIFTTNWYAEDVINQTNYIIELIEYKYGVHFQYIEESTHDAPWLFYVKDAKPRKVLPKSII